MDESIKEEAMKDIAILILALYTLANAGIIYYFLIYKNRQADKVYDERIRSIMEHRARGKNL